MPVKEMETDKMMMKIMNNKKRILYFYNYIYAFPAARLRGSVGNSKCKDLPTMPIFPEYTTRAMLVIFRESDELFEMVLMFTRVCREEREELSESAFVDSESDTGIVFVFLKVFGRRDLSKRGNLHAAAEGFL